MWRNEWAREGASGVAAAPARTKANYYVQHAQQNLLPLHASAIFLPLVVLLSLGIFDQPLLIACFFPFHGTRLVFSLRSVLQLHSMGCLLVSGSVWLVQTQPKHLEIPLNLIPYFPRCLFLQKRRILPPWKLLVFCSEWERFIGTFRIVRPEPDEDTDP